MFIDLCCDIRTGAIHHKYWKKLRERERGERERERERERDRQTDRQTHGQRQSETYLESERVKIFITEAKQPKVTRGHS